MLRGQSIIGGMKLDLPDEIREFFRRKGKLGAKRRQQVLSPEKRREIARIAAQARWSKQLPSKKAKASEADNGGKKR